jgi:hypothetical protein
MKLILGFLVVALSTFTGVAFGSPSNEPQVIELRKGDIIPLEYSMDGDFVETLRSAQISLRAKENLWIRISASQVEVSFDGTNFKPFSSVASGSLEIGAQNASAFTAKVTLKAK